VEYGLALDLEVLRLLLSLKAANRTRLLQWLKGLKGAPFTKGQFTVLDSTDRDIEVSRVSNFLVYHWTDHPAKTIQVVRIEINF
jgi:hypothetical protein